MITIANNKVFVQGKQTTDPTLIGLTMLDAIELKQDMAVDHSDRRDKINAYIKAKRLRNTLERRNLIDIYVTKFCGSSAKIFLASTNFSTAARKSSISIGLST
jgi:hypothetical protein